MSRINSLLAIRRIKSSNFPSTKKEYHKYSLGQRSALVLCCQEIRDDLMLLYIKWIDSGISIGSIFQ